MFFLKKLNLIFFCFFLFGFFLIPFFISGQGLEIQYPSIPFGNIQTPNQFAGQENALPLYLNYFYHFVLMIAGFITFGTVVFGGTQYLTSAGSMTKIINAKEQIFGGFMGLIILLSSYMILIAIDPDLTVFNITALEEKIETTDVPEIDFGKTVYFEIPIGMIIENAVLDDLYLQKMNIAKQAAEQASQASQELKNLTNQLKQEIDNCNCGTTSGCSPPSCVGTNCFGAQCNKAEIERLSKEIEKQIETLDEKQTEVQLAKSPLADDLSQLEAASFLMSLKNDEIFSYNNLLSIEEDYEVETFFGWEDLYLKINDEPVKDPLTFYLEKEKNKREIYLASIWQWESIDFPPEPPGGWPDAPHIEPGKLVWPTRTNDIRISSPYGYRCRYWDKKKGCGIYSEVNDPKCIGTKCWELHSGIDIVGSGIRGTPAYSIADGVVIGKYRTAGSGNIVIIAHPSLNISSAYIHLLNFSVNLGQEVKRGEAIGGIDNTGIWTTGDHLHFEYRAGTASNQYDYWLLRPIDPCKGAGSNLSACMANF
jgi:murein DD-endopeptidase MepM/ murein hydrolase activator NlpD